MTESSAADSSSMTENQENIEKLFKKFILPIGSGLGSGVHSSVPS